MKQLQLSPPLLIITMGYPGSGKTFFARQFAELYGIARVSEERVRFELLENPQFNDDEADIIGRITHYMIEQLMQTKQTIVCEGAFAKNKERRELQELAKTHGYRTLTVWLQTDIDTAFQRANKRDRRNLDSKYAFSLDRATFANLKDRLERPGEKEVAVVVSGKHAFKSQNLTVLKKIAAVYSAQISKDLAGASPQTARPTPTGRASGQRYIQ